MKEHLAGKRHADDEDLQHAVVDSVLQKLQQLAKKCIELRGEYVE
jgi:hypothetical protein